MELKALTTAFREIVGGDDCEAVRVSLQSERKDEILSQYVELVDGDLATDNLQRIFQYYHADRKEKMQDFTPKSIGKLCASETKTDGRVVYDLCAGSGALTIQKWVQEPNKVFICEELDYHVIPLLLFNMAVRNMTGWVVNRNALTMEEGKCYRLEPGEQFSNISETAAMPEIMADEIVSNPPYNIRWQAPAPLTADSRFQGKPIPSSANANYAFVLTALSRMKEGGRCAFVLPRGVLSGDGESEVREYLVDAGLVERVIVLPGNMFESTSIGTCVIVFSHGNESVKMYDCRQFADSEDREQNGQYGGAAHENRTYKKVVNVLPDELIDRLCGECENIPEYSKEVINEEIRNNDFLLTPSRYLELAERETVHRPYADIMEDINRIARERSIIKITCNETYAKEMGIYEAAKLEEQTDEIDLDRTFQMLGGHYEHRPYLTLTKSKVFKIENQDKEYWSSLIAIFMPMWKQHIFYLNQEENRLLAELRDAMLPELMSGKLELPAEA